MTYRLTHSTTWKAVVVGKISLNKTQTRNYITEPLYVVFHAACSYLL